MGEQLRIPSDQHQNMEMATPFEDQLRELIQTDPGRAMAIICLGKTLNQLQTIPLPTIEQDPRYPYPDYKDGDGNPIMREVIFDATWASHGAEKRARTLQKKLVIEAWHAKRRDASSHA